jgi:hypothetical protein
MKPMPTIGIRDAHLLVQLFNGRIRKLHFKTSAALHVLFNPPLPLTMRQLRGDSRWIKKLTAANHLWR